MLCTCSSSSYRHSLLSNGTSWRRKSLWQFPHALTLHTNSSILSMAWWACRRGDIPINPSSSWGDSSLWLLSSELWVGEKKKSFVRRWTEKGVVVFHTKLWLSEVLANKQSSILVLYWGRNSKQPAKKLLHSQISENNSHAWFILHMLSPGLEVLLEVLLFKLCFIKVQIQSLRLAAYSPLGKNNHLFYDSVPPCML